MFDTQTHTHTHKQAHKETLWFNATQFNADA